MANKPVLTIAFLESRPTAAARVLAQMDAVNAAIFLDTLPTRVLVAVLSKMGASPAAVLLGKMNPTSAAAVLRAHDYTIAAAILRLVPPEQRAVILEQLPQKLSRSFALSLSFPIDTIGAHMTTSIVMLGDNNTVGDAKAHIPRSGQSLADPVFVVGEDRRLSGVVSATLLLRHGDDTALASIMKRDVMAMSARARLSTAVGLEAWDTQSALPVLSRQQHLIGALTRGTAGRAEDMAQQFGGTAPPPLIGAIAAAFLDCVIGLGDTIADIRGLQSISTDQEE